MFYDTRTGSSAAVPGSASAVTPGSSSPTISPAPHSPRQRPIMPFP
ncbi:MAG: hypothetical protein HC838_07770 [Spirulinaceae cyanobacterium RM2_2_10]|nr:hypothetical protein [Spirulinaceae cyanobacterium SM2_1_0]NJO19972.1 hypothetical protein [Spirulinaceae cyanobacterium RM2_2_10]